VVKNLYYAQNPKPFRTDGARLALSDYGSYMRATPLVEQKLHSIGCIPTTQSMLVNYLNQPIEYSWTLMGLRLLQILH